MITRDGEFLNWLDVFDWLLFMQNKLLETQANATQSDVTEKIEIFEDEVIAQRKTLWPYIHDRDNSPEPGGIYPEGDSFEMWHSFKIVLSGGTDYPSEEAERIYFWGCWRDFDAEPIMDVGLTETTETFLSTRLASTRHDYSRDAPVIEPWELHEAIQGNYTFYVGAAKAKEIDAVSRVPSIEPLDNAKDGARWILNADTLTETWQRKLDEKRVKAIANFAQTSERNSIVNSIILYIPPDAQGVYLDVESGQLSFDFKEFLARIDVETHHIYRDYTLEGEGVPDKDHRPIWILDGQHRTRGLAISARGSELMLPIIVLIGGEEDNEFSLSDAAKLFTEINTLNKTLNKEMQYMLGQRFEINGSNSDNDWGDYHDQTVPDSVRARRRANHLGYTFALRLCEEDDGPLSGAIQFFGGRASSTIRYMIAVWLKEARKWFKNGIYKIDNGVDDEDIFSEIWNYYAALDRTFNFNTRNQRWDVRPNLSRWIPTRGLRTSLIEKKIQCKNLMILLPHVIEQALSEDSERNRPISAQEFEILLQPLRNVDWLNKPLQDIYTGGGEQRRSATLSWMIDAIRFVNRNNLPPIASVMTNDRDLANNAGSAIMAPPGTTTIERVENYPPTADALLMFYLHAPRNCWREIKELSQIRLDFIDENDEKVKSIDLLQTENAELETIRDDHNNLSLCIKIKSQHILLALTYEKYIIHGHWSNEVGQGPFEVTHLIGD